MNWKHYVLMALPIPVFYLYKGRDGTEKVSSRRKAVYPVNMMPHPIADQLHGVYWKRENMPDLDELFDSKPETESSEYRCPYLDQSKTCL